MRLESKVALITGGYGGMGRASARLFAREGATVFVAGRSHERGDTLVAEINGAGGKAHFVGFPMPDFAVQEVTRNIRCTGLVRQKTVFHETQ